MLREPTPLEKRRRAAERPLGSAARMEGPTRRPCPMNAPETPPLRLTAFSHGGGCGCKIAPGVLRQILAQSAPAAVPAALLVGIEDADDAAVWQLDSHQAIVATTDFFMPIVDDPHDFGAIAATNAISDLYAMGATPLFALALVGMPVDRLPVETIRAILAGGESACRRAGIPIAGGHTIDSVEPIYGLVAIGVVDPRHVKRNGGAQAGDVLILGKPLGMGIYSAALKRDRLSAAQYATLVDSGTRLNTPGLALARDPSVHAMTDVTGFGLLGHLLGMCRASRAAATLSVAAVPLHPGVAELATEGLVTGASARNWAGYGHDVTIDPAVPAWTRDVLTDPQTSGGLLVACAPEARAEVLARFAAEGFAPAVIGAFAAGAAAVHVR